jgi:hypothetical protein
MNNCRVVNLGGDSLEVARMKPYRAVVTIASAGRCGRVYDSPEGDRQIWGY